MESEDNHIIHAFPRGKGQEIQISLRKHNDKYYIDLRQWFQSKNEACFLPTKKGVNFSVNSLTEFRKGVERLTKAIQRLKSAQESVEI